MTSNEETRCIVVNNDWGGFGLSEEATDWLAERGVDDADRDIDRDDPRLVECVKELGDDGCSDLAIVEIPGDVEWEIMEYDGKEWVAEEHRTWRP